MNTDYILFVALFVLPFVVLPYLLALVAFRAIRERSLTAVKVYRWSYSRWEYDRTASIFGQGLSWRWPFMELVPRWYMANEALSVVAWKDLDKADSYWSERWHKDYENYLLVRRPDRTVRQWLLLVNGLLIGVLAAALWLSANLGALRAAPEPTPTVATPVYATPRPTPTPRITNTCQGVGLRNGSFVLAYMPAAGGWWGESSVAPGQEGPSECPVFTSATQVAVWDFDRVEWVYTEPANEVREGESYYLSGTPEPLDTIHLYDQDGQEVSLVGQFDQVEVIFVEKDKVQVVYMDEEGYVQTDEVIFYEEVTK